KCIGERGKFQMKIERPDPAFEGLPEIFEIVESHIGQINHVPKGWHRLVTKGPGAHTVNQCLRTDDGPTYAAQFHMEMYQSTVETSKQIMSNFLRVAQESSADETRTVRVRVEVTTPDATEATDDEPGEVFLAGDLKLLGRWRPDGFKLSRADNGVYFAEFSVPPETLVQFKVTRGSWQTVEKDTAGRDIANRQFEVKESKDGEPQRISVRVERWGVATTAKPNVTGTLEFHKDVASEHLTQTRNVSVWLPPGYAESDDRYPVLYLQDGQNLFDSSKAAFGVEWQVDETATQLIEKHEIPSVIIVGIWNTPERIDEYTLTRDSRIERGGSGLNYIRFMAEELKPLIDRTYRTRTEREATLIGGSSLGGLISMEACLQRPDVFGVCLAFSPSLGWDQERILDTLRKDGWPENVHLWISMGTQEGRDPETQTRNLTRARRVHELIVPSGSESPVRIRLQEFADGSHDETSWATQFPSALKSVLSAESLRD
ncbi:MAG: alpha/beta hydrolase-fold protein, partial [Planctomycetaceae bacterium]